MMLHSSASGVSPGYPHTMMDSGYSLTDMTLEKAVQRLLEIERENNALRDNLREQNTVMRKQYEALSVWRKKEATKFDQTKAVITALREENQELQVKVMSQEDKTRHLESQMNTMESTNFHLRRQKALSDQRAFNMIKQAEEQGVTDLQPHEGEGDTDTMVFVTTVDKEQVISELEHSQVEKEEYIEQLRLQILKKESEAGKFRDSTNQLLKDMESQQKLKVEIEKENHSLKQQMMQAEQEQHQKMQSDIATTKRQMESVHAFAVGATGGTEVLLSFPEHVEDLKNFCKGPETQHSTVKASLEYDQLKAEVDQNNAIKLQLMNEVEKLTTEVSVLMTKLNTVERQLDEAREDVKTTADRLSGEYEQKLIEMAKQNSSQGTRSLQASETEDMSILRSQVLTLIKEVDETQSKLSAAIAAINKKNERILELDEMRRNVEFEFSSHWQETHTLIQNLQSQLADQHRSQMDNNALKSQYQQLQASFNRLVSDYKELVDTFDNYKIHADERLLMSRATPSQSMDEISRLTAQVIAADEAISLRDEQMATLRINHNMDGSKNAEEILLLKMQADIYQKDFEAERHSRTTMKEEKNQLEGEMIAVQERCRLLQDELESYNQRQITDMQRRVRPGSTISQGTAARMPFTTIDGPDRLRVTPPLAHDFVRGAAGGGYTAPQDFGSGLMGGGGGYTNMLVGTVAAPPQGTEFEEDTQSFQQYECPSCNAPFPDIDSLQLHVPECIDNEQDPNRDRMHLLR